MPTNHKLNELNHDFLRMIDLATDPAMKSTFEKAHVAFNVLAIQLGHDALNSIMDHHDTKRVMALLDNPPDVMLERLTDMGWTSQGGDLNFNGIPSFKNPQWPYQPECYHALHISDVNGVYYYDLTIYTGKGKTAKMWYQDTKNPNMDISPLESPRDVYDLIENGRKYLRHKGWL